MMQKERSLIDTHQKYWQLAFIQSSSLGLPILLLGGSFLKNSNPGSIISSIVIGNLISWVIGLIMVLMTPKKHNAIENVAHYLGKKTMLIAGLILSFAFIGWYSLQIEATVELFKSIYDLSPVQKLKIGSALGAIIAFISIGGIKLIRWITCICFPIFLAFYVFLGFKCEFISIFKAHWEPSIHTITFVTLSLLPGFINLPTFFRHAQSKAHAVGGLSLTTFNIILFQIFFVLIGINSIVAFSETLSSSIILVLFTILSLVCINLVNIYFSAATWEVALSQYAGAKGHVLSGLIGTLFYCVLQGSKSMELVNNVMDGFISCLGFVLLIEYSLKALPSHWTTAYEKRLSNFSWAVGCITILCITIMNPFNSIKSIGWGIGGAVITFIAVIFFKETFWAIKTLVKRKKE